MESMDFEELGDYLLSNIFNEDVYEVFPALEDCYDKDPVLMESIFMNFYTDLCDLSKDVVKPFLDEKATYMYRKVYGIYDDGFFQTKASVGKRYGITGTRIGQIIKSCDLRLVNSFIRDFKALSESEVISDVAIEELALSNGIYLKLKRLGFNYLSEIDTELLRDCEGFGDKTINKINEGISRVRK